MTDMYQHLELGSIGFGTNRDSSFGGDQSTALHWHYGYDANDNQDRIVDPMGQVTGGPEPDGGMEFDYLDRLHVVTYSPTNPNLPFQMQRIVYTYDGNSNLSNVEETKNDASSTPTTEIYTYEYDNLDRLVRSTYVNDGKIITYNYFDNGNRQSVTTDNVTTTYDYDSRNRISSVTNEAGTTTYTYDPDSLLQHVSFGNGVTSDYSYDKASRLTLLVNSNGSGVISSYEYTYDGDGNRKTQIEIQRDLNGGAPETTTYDYDQLDRLTGVTYPGLAELNYTYSFAGNRLSEIRTDPNNPGNDVNRTYEYDNVNRLLSIADTAVPKSDVVFTYDDNGNRTAKLVGSFAIPGDSHSRFTVKSQTTYDYGVRNELLRVQISSGDTVLFDYDYANMRVKNIDRMPSSGMGSSPTEIRYLYDGNSTVLEYDGASLNTLRKYDKGNGLLSVTEVNPAASLARSSQFYQVDGLGSTVNLTDSSGVIQQSYEYDAWGNIRAQAGGSLNAKTYNGHYFDSETGLDYFGARYYDPDVGLFITQDSLLGEAETPASQHRYMYALDNPLTYVDLTGHMASLRQWLGIDPTSESVALTNDPSIGTEAGLAAKESLYAVGNFLTGGFLEHHDALWEAREAGRISESQYWIGTSLYAVKSVLTVALLGKLAGGAANAVREGGVLANLRIGAQGVLEGGPARTAFLNSVWKNAAGGGVIGGVDNLLDQGIDYVSGLKSEFDPNAFAKSAGYGILGGMAYGVVTGVWGAAKVVGA
jgi:RHS repeat-associated protein